MGPAARWRPPGTRPPSRGPRGVGRSSPARCPAPSGSWRSASPRAAARSFRRPGARLRFRHLRRLAGGSPRPGRVHGTTVAYPWIPLRQVLAAVVAVLVEEVPDSVEVDRVEVLLLVPCQQRDLGGHRLVLRRKELHLRKLLRAGRRGNRLELLRKLAEHVLGLFVEV